MVFGSNVLKIGGANTAGMGGKGGPFRLDSGHNVAQISKEEKAKVSKEVTEAARAMAKVNNFFFP